MRGAASTTGNGVLVDAAWVAAHEADPAVRVIEVDVSRAAYDEGHLPGAVLWNAYSDLRDAAYRPVGHAQLERLLSRSGVAADTTLVFCGYGAMLGLWLMSAHGHADVRALAGPRERWLLEGGQWSTEVPDPPATAYALTPATAELLASRAAVEAALEDPGQVLLDVRAESEFNGERFWPSGATADAGRAGHVPGAVSVPIDRLRNEDDSFKAAEELQHALDSAGVTNDRNVIVYCTIGNRASQAWFVLRHLLGYPHVSVYYGSWVEWGKQPDTAVECGPPIG
jgi:thiosulfate/3-mercaptopyruvate sulfurtransferase